MAFNGSGTFIREHDWTTDDGNGINITASRLDTETDGIATGLSSCITKDGQTILTANIPFNSKKITGLADGTARTDSITLGQVQDGTYGNLGASSGTDTYRASPSPAITVYTANQRFTVEIGVDNPAASTLNISAVGAEALEKYDGEGATVALEAGDLQAGQKYDVVRDQANTKFIVLNPQSSYMTSPYMTSPYITNAINIAKSTTSTYGVSYISNPITISNGTDADHDIDFTAGNFIFSGGGGQGIVSAETKKLDATWAAGSAAGGLADALTIAADTTYHCFALSNALGTVTGFGFDTSLTATNLLADTAVIAAGLTKYKKIASLVTDSSSNILNGTYTFNPDASYDFTYNSSILDLSITTIVAARTAFVVSAPPNVDVEVNVSYQDNDSGSGYVILFKNENQTDVAASASVYTLASNNTSVGATCVQAHFKTDSSSQLFYRGLDTASYFLRAQTIGWTDNNL